VDPTGTIPLSQRVPCPEFAGILLAAADGHGNYNAGTIAFTKKFSQGLSLLANYTYAKSIDDTSTEINFTFRPEEGRKDMRGPSDFDVNHRAVFSYIYQLPVGKGRRYLNRGGVANAVLGGWQVSGITTFMSGPPHTVHFGGATAAIRGPLLFTRPDCVSNPNKSSFRHNVRNNGLVYFDVDAFQAPAPFTLGNCGRNPLRLPGINKWDLAAHKYFDFGERVKLQARFEFFNAWNHAQFLMGAPNTSANFTTDRTFGRVIGARYPRDIQIGLKLIF
jgi:hypothetical protein